MITRKFGPEEMKVLQRLPEKYGQIVQSVTQDHQTGDIVYQLSEPSHQTSIFETETGVPVAFTRRVGYDLAEELLASLNTKNIGSALRKYRFNDFVQWAQYHGVNVKGEHDDALLMALNPVAFESDLNAARDHILFEVEKIREIYRMSNNPRINTDDAQIAYAVLEADNRRLTIEIHPYKNFDDDSETGKLDGRFTGKDLQIVRELTGIEETENLRRQILDKIREGQIIVDENAVKEMLEQPHLPEELKMLYSGLKTDEPNIWRADFIDGALRIRKIKP